MAQFLENGRYHRALRSARRGKNGDFRDLELYFQEQWATHVALDRLGVLPNVSPKRIPGIDQHHVRYDLLQQLTPNFIIDIIGTLNSGKSSIVDGWLSDSTNQTLCWFVDEVAKGIIGMRGPGQVEVEMFNLATRISVRDEITRVSRMFDPRLVVDPAQQQPILISRGLVDRVVFQRTYFESGKIPPSFFERGYKTYPDDPLSFDAVKVPVGAVIMLLTSPSISVKREPKDSKRNYVKTRRFQTRLYHQYLRVYEELLSGRLTNRDVTEVDMPVPIVVALNMEDGLDECYEKFSRVMQHVLFVTGRL